MVIEINEHNFLKIKGNYIEMSGDNTNSTAGGTRKFTFNYYYYAADQ